MLYDFLWKELKFQRSPTVTCVLYQNLVWHRWHLSQHWNLLCLPQLPPKQPSQQLQGTKGTRREASAHLPYSLLGVPSLSVASEGRSRGSSFRSLSGLAALSSARSSAALMSLRRESSGLLSCPVIIGSWKRGGWGAQVGNREEKIKRENTPG